MTILIPAYKPDQRLIRLIHDLMKQCEYDIVVVDDGSGPDYKHIFKAILELDCIVLTHEKNRGKGAALKTGFKFIQKTGENTGVVTADCDGQNLAKDIIKVAEALKNEKETIVLGTRQFVGNVPIWSCLGNSITRIVFSFVSGVKVYDTQTGLRGFLAEMLPWLCRIPGDRYEYEMNVLIEAALVGYRFKEIDIETVYLDQNKSSHFHPLRDSLRVCLPIIKFVMSSLISSLVDFVLFVIIQLSTRNLLLAVIGARICSAILNYTINRYYVFSRNKKASIKSSLLKYFILATIVMCANYSVINLFYSIIGISVFFAKILTEITIFFFSYWAQRKFVFVK
ncbi:MAG TPA: glycosyltransferase [Clostridiaceae bacterium]|nr:glycosyltransferase [Clostridiaceae bacterium]